DACGARACRQQPQDPLGRRDVAAVRTGPADHPRIRASGPAAAPCFPNARSSRRSTLRATEAVTPRCPAVPARFRPNGPMPLPCPPAAPDTPTAPRSAAVPRYEPALPPPPLQQALEALGETRTLQHRTRSRQHPRHEGGTVQRVVPDRQRLPGATEQHLLMGDEPR